MQLKRISVFPKIPTALRPLRELAYNLWWSWQPDAIALFEEMDTALWEKVYHNPVKLLRQIRQKRLQDLSEDKGFLGRMDAVLKHFEADLALPCLEERGLSKTHPVAYFSAEFGLHESLQVYSGGLGILAGDHCKSASDLGVPLVGIGLLYKSGYFVQTLNAEGMQEASYPPIDFDNLPIQIVREKEGTEIRISLVIAGRKVAARIWEVKVGRTPLYLLDTDLAENEESSRLITSKLYGGGGDMRIAQEMLLGIGGVRALRSLGIDPAVYHINEGHAAFLALERLRELMQDEGLRWEEALNVIAANQVFTTHTPVEAGHDRFDVQFFGRFVGPYIETLGVDFETAWRLGTIKASGYDEPFCMTILALRTCRLSNGVSKLHGEVSRKMWHAVWPAVPEDEIPIGHITNGVHADTWLSQSFRKLYERTLGPDRKAHHSDPAFWDRILQIPDEEVWQTHLERKQALVGFIRDRVAKQRLRVGESTAAIEKARKMLDPEALTIGFARRFAPYKRAELLFQDPQRLKAILQNPERPVQIIFAGKSHPHNQEGKDTLQKVYQFTRHPDFEGKIVFVEDYDTNVGRFLVQGVDLWLNNPIRPQEASGTSGQKVPLNGGLNLSILDGWWVEGYQGTNGWIIGGGVEYGSRRTQDLYDAQSLYDVLETQIVPLYYQHSERHGRPDGWIQRMKESMRTVIPVFNTHRMVSDYLQQMYLPMAERGLILRADYFQKGRELTEWKAKLQKAWPQIRVALQTAPPSRPLEVGSPTPVEALVQIADVDPADICVELYLAHLDERGEPHTSRILPMKAIENAAPHVIRYRAELQPEESGEYGYSVRVRPVHPLLLHPHETGLLRWP